MLVLHSIFCARFKVFYSKHIHVILTNILSEGVTLQNSRYIKMVAKKIKPVYTLVKKDNMIMTSYVYNGRRPYLTSMPEI